MVESWRGVASIHSEARCYDWAVVPIHEIKVEEIRGVVYLHRLTKGQVDGVKFYMMDGTSHVYEGDDLPLALALARERFRPEEAQNS